MTSEFEGRVISGLRCCSQHATMCPSDCPYDNTDGNCIYDLARDALQVIKDTKSEAERLRTDKAPAYARNWKKLLKNYRDTAIRCMDVKYPGMRWVWWHRHDAQISMLRGLGLIDLETYKELSAEWHDAHDPRPVAMLLNERQLLDMDPGTVVWRESHWVDDEGEHSDMAPMMRCVVCGKACLADGESQTLITGMRFGPDGDDAFQERYWSGVPTDAQRAATPWEGVSGE